MWNRFDWSDALLDHFFRRRPDRDGPVRVIVATDDELAEATGDPSADPARVAESLVQTVLSAVGDENYWKHAAASVTEKRPTYVAHLVVACMAAVDLTDIDEGSYIERLCNLIGPKGERSLSKMADLWRALERWLREHPDSYRPLILPDPRGWTRIGHTVRLAFPSRRDQVRLFHELSADGLLLESPPVGAVKATIERRGSRFSPRFQDELAEFSGAFDRGDSISELLSTPLWDAVEAVVQLSLNEEGDTARRRWTLLGEDQWFDLDLRVVTTEAGELEGRSVSEAEYSPEPWCYELAGPQALSDVLTGKIGAAGRLSNLVRGGLIPLVQALHQDLEIAERQDYAQAECVLVRDDLLSEVQGRFGGQAGELSVAGWSVLRESSVELLDPAQLGGTSLATCWAIHKTVFPPSIRLIGGIKVGGGYLNLRSHLPTVRAEGARSALVEVDGEVSALDGLDGLFTLPASAIPIEWAGSATLLVEFPGEARMKSMTLIASPSVERFKRPNDLTAWLAEGCARSAPIESDLSPQPGSPSRIRFADQVIYLGASTGTWVTNAEEAAWEITAFGSRSIGSVVADPESGALPPSQSADGGARRRWRKMMKSAIFPVERHRDLRNRATAASGLPDATTVESAQLSSTVAKLSPQRVDGLVETIVALANNRIGITTRQFLELSSDLLGLTPDRAWPVLRSWIEAGALAEGVNRRWSNRRLFARPPRLVMFETDRWVAGRVSGLTLESTNRHLEQVAEAHGVLSARQGSESGLTPESVAFRADDGDAIQEVGRVVGIPTSTLAPTPWEMGGGPDATGAIPVNYEKRGRSFTDPRWGDVSLQRWTRPDAPRFWVASSVRAQVWAYHREVALFWGCAIAEVESVNRAGLHLDVAATYLPLTAARRLNCIATVLSGPTRDGGYRYHCPTHHYAELLMQELHAFEASHVAELVEGN